MKRSKSNPFSLFSFQDIITGLCGIMIFFVLIMIIDLAMSNTTAAEEKKQNNKERIEKVQQRIDAQEAELAMLQQEMQELEILEANQSSEVKQYALEKKIKAEITDCHEIQMEIEELKASYAEVKEMYDSIAHSVKILKDEKEHIKAEAKVKDVEFGVTYVPEKHSSKDPIFVLCDCEAIILYRNSSRRGEYVTLHLPFDTFKEEFETVLDKYLNPKTHCLIFLIRPSGISYAKELISIATKQEFAIGRTPLEEEVKITLGGEE